MSEGWDWDDWQIKWDHTCYPYCLGCGYDFEGQCLVRCPECSRELPCAQYPLSWEKYER
jgi:hypothetical protein